MRVRAFLTQVSLLRNSHAPARNPPRYTLDEVPTAQSVARGQLAHGRGEGVVGVRSGRDVIRLFDGAAHALQQCHDGAYPTMRLAVASSADTPRAVEIGRAAMALLEVVPGVTVKEVLLEGWDDERCLQIGRSPPLSSNKAQTHFPILREATGVPYDGMLFFDDSNWSDHCRIVETNCKGVVTQRTPRGMTIQEWENGLKKFAERTRG